MDKVQVNAELIEAQSSVFVSSSPAVGGQLLAVPAGAYDVTVQIPQLPIRAKWRVGTSGDWNEFEGGEGFTVSGADSARVYLAKFAEQSASVTAAVKVRTVGSFTAGSAQVGVVTSVTDTLTGGIGNLSASGQAYFGPVRQSYAPYKLATFGDSRANVNSAGPDVSGHASSLAATKGPSWTAAYRKDTELTHNFGVSGDSAAGWSASARTGGKTVVAFVSCGAELVHIQYGVNDIITGNGTTPNAATITGYLKALVLEAVKTGMSVVFESILPCTSEGWTSAGGGTAAQKQAIADAVNASMQAFISSVPNAVYADTAALLKDPATGYANPVYYIDKIHLNNVGAMLSGKTCSSASYSILPKKQAIYYPSGIQSGANFVDSFAPPITTILSGIAGTFNLNSQTIGCDGNGPYVEFVIQALTLASGEATFWAAIGGDVGAFGGSSKYAIAANDVLQGQAHLIIDDGEGGKPSGLRNFVLRHRCYYQAGGGFYADFGSYTLPSGMADILEPVDVLVTTPRVTTTVASSGIEPTTHVKGYGLHIYVSVSQTTSPVRIRVYAPMLRKAA